MENRSKTFLGFLTGFLLLSLAFTVFSHITVGQETCELAQSSDGPIASVNEDIACTSIPSKWINFVSDNPRYNLFFWLTSLIGGTIGAGTAYYRNE